MKKKILIVEKSEDLRNYLKEKLEFHDFEIILAKDGLDGYIKMRGQLPDLIIIDLFVPRLNKNDFLEKKCPFLSNETRKGIASQSLGEFEVYGNQHSLSWLRSEYMKQYAEANCNRKAVWKVGDKHVDDIEKIEGKNYHRKYNLIKMGYFESKIFRYTSRGGHFRKLGGFFKQ